MFVRSRENRKISERLQIIALPGMLEEAVMALRDHRCTIEQDEYRTVVTFPLGTTREELLPRTMEARYTLILPDEYRVMQQEVREHGMSVLFYEGAGM